MKEKLKNIKLDITLSAIVTLLIGVAFVLWPGQVATVFAKVVAIAVIFVGAIILIAKLIAPEGRIVGLIISILLILIGIWIFVSPAQAASLLPMVIGVIMVAQGINDMIVAAEIVKNHGKRSWTGFLYGVITILFGVYCVLSAFTIVKAIYILIGIMLMVDGLTSMIVVGKANKARRDIIDVEVKSERDADDYI